MKHAPMKQESEVIADPFKMAEQEQAHLHSLQERYFVIDEKDSEIANKMAYRGQTFAFIIVIISVISPLPYVIYSGIKDIEDSRAASCGEPKTSAASPQTIFNCVEPHR